MGTLGIKILSSIHVMSLGLSQFYTSVMIPYRLNRQVCFSVRSKKTVSRVHKLSSPRGR